MTSQVIVNPLAIKTNFANPGSTKKYAEDAEISKGKNKLQNFASNVSILGVKYIFDGAHSYMRRILWLCLVLTGFGFLLFHIHDRFTYFMKSPVSIKTEMAPEAELEFPKITICNNNHLSLKSLTDAGVRYLETFSSIRAMSRTKTNVLYSQLSFHGISNMNMTKMYIEYGHDMRDLIRENVSIHVYVRIMYMYVKPYAYW